VAEDQSITALAEPLAAEPAASTGPETQTLQFENARVLLQLSGNDLGLLKLLEEKLDVRATTREGWIRFEGEAGHVAQARQVFEQLDLARQSGTVIRKHEFLYALRAVTETDGVSPALASLASIKIQTSARRPPVVAKTPGQFEYLKTIARHDVVFGVGPAGTGKTFLAMSCALAALRKEEVSRIILTRPAVEAGEALGFLPGDLQEKIFPYLRPLYDALHVLLEPDELQRYMERRMVEIAPLAYMRGRTLDHAFIVLDEAQNTTTEQMFMFLTRMGQGSKCVVTGDRTQIDLPQNKRSGLVEAIQALKDIHGIGFTYFEERDVVRHELVQAIIRAYRQHRYGDGSAPPAEERGRRKN
jgi:phosphate starvation-inducible PhoH-like protein